MLRQLRIRNCLVAVSTFGLGVAVAGVFAPELANVSDPQITHVSDTTCVAANHSGARRGIFDTERGFQIEDRIRVTQTKLTEIKKRSSISAPGRETKMRVEQRRLEAKLQRLVADRRKLFSEQGFAGDEAKLVYGEVCSEH